MNNKTIYTIYRVTNTVNNKCYVGFTSNFKKRKFRHLKDANSDSTTAIFHRAIKKWGEDSFKWEELYQSRDADHTLNVMEPHFITENNSHKSNWGYNMTFGGEGCAGRLGLPARRAATNQQGEICWVTKNEIEQSGGSIKPLSLTTITNNGTITTVTSDYYRENKNKLTHVNKGKVTVRDKNGTILQVDIHNSEYQLGELIPVSIDTIPVKNCDGTKTRIHRDDPRYKSGEFIHTSKNTVWWNNGIKSTMSEECPGEGWIRGNLGTTNSGQTWWNNGVECIMMQDCPGEGWVPGRLGDFKATTAGKTCYNNGKNNVFSYQHPGDGWVKGMIKNTKK
jgi:group I intron endonuclease